MYKVFINDKPVFIIVDENSIYLDDALFIQYDSPEKLLSSIESFEKNKSANKLYITAKNAEEVWNIFKSLFINIDAAGGLVKNLKNELLFIFRNGKWDLPKGKVEKNEVMEQAAVREVEEECGIKGLTIVREYSPTYHIYTLKNQRILKKTYWFEMICNYSGKLKPQIEEGITKVKWMNKKEVKKALKNTYGSIKDVIGEWEKRG